MNTQHTLTPRAPLPRNTRLEDLGFGLTLAAIAVAPFVAAFTPALGDWGAVAGWGESCVKLVTIGGPIAAAVIGLAG
jgi:hypothetical protein